ncbi:SDR family oxidoreductase [Gracilimonas sp.]|uniref:SDR family oxidoreductase n=1 Tax=Gracilimonas sp. TaxID=1974203 RepID=UPI0032ECA228
MNVLVIGANGQIGKRLVHQLKESNHGPVAMVRKEEQVDQFKENGIDTVLGDLEDDFTHAFEDIDAVVFSAGSGGHTPKSQTKVIDRDGAIKAIDEAEKAGRKRFIMVSALKANRDSETWSEPMEHYYDAKAKADERLRNSDLDYTVLMPGRLTNEEGIGKVELKERIESIDNKTITRDDVATVIVELLDAKQSYKKSLELLQGSTPIKEAISNLN